jgi:hypothetical protein
MAWVDDNPYFLLIKAAVPEPGEDEPFVIIDLGQPGWSKTHAAWMRRPSTWHLCRKTNGQVALVMRVLEGEQPYYTRRHVGQIGQDGSRHREVSCFGIGKKRLDGHVDRIWIMPDGYAVCGGDDVEPLALEVVRTLEWV